MIKFFLKYYLPAILWAIIIFSFSMMPGGEYYPETASYVFTRKGAHFIEFSIFVFLVFRILFFAHKFSLRKAYVISLFISVLYGFSDEFHQTFTYGRTGRVIDAVFDGVSSFLFLEVIIIYIQRKIKWKNFFVLVFSIAILAGLEFKMINDGEKKRLELEKKAVKIKEDIIVKEEVDDISKDNFLSDKKTEKIDVEKEKNPDEFLMAVPFTSQAPFKLWDEIHEEACEEASLVMLKYFLEEKVLTPEIAENEIQALVKFQNKKTGDFKDTSAKETVDLFLDFYGELESGKSIKVVYDFKKEDLKKYIARGFPVIIPAAGRKLGNPNFKSPGPLYHNLVLIGYDNKGMIITNDPGTRKGAGYKYETNILYEAIHDFTGDPEDIEKGRKAMIVIE